MVFKNAILMGQVSDFSRTFRLDGAKQFDSLENFPYFKKFKKIIFKFLSENAPKITKF